MNQLLINNDISISTKIFNKIIISSSKLRELSTMIGACVMVNNSYKTI